MSDFDDGKKAGIEIGKVMARESAYSIGYEDGYDMGHTDGWDECYEKVSVLSQYDLEEYFNCTSNIVNSSTIEKMVIGLKEQVGESSHDLEDLKNALDYHFGDKLK